MDSRDVTIAPAVCYDVCNNVWLEVQTVKKNPSICSLDSPLWKTFTQCQTCCEVNDAEEIFRDSIRPAFQEYLDYCTVVQVVTSVVMTVRFPITVTVSNSEVVTTTRGPMDYLTATSLPSTGSAVTSRAWIAGPVIGFIAVIALIIGFWFLRYRRRQANQPATGETGEVKKEYTKAQLHSDSLPPKPAIELEGSYPNPMPEMSANEVAAQEMLVPRSHHVAEMPERHD